ncbi:transcriptional regulator MalT, partial [Escherichia coli]|nr:transcriptional regulator MalT [Escherichia coli]
LLEEAEEEHKKRNIALDIHYQGQANALLAQVAINSNQPEKALELAELALSQLDNTIYRSRIVATSVVGEVNHVLGKLDRALPMMQQTEKLA